MGLLDNILNAPQKTEKDYFTPNSNIYDKTKIFINCQSCGREFRGQGWMRNTRKIILCPDCFRHENLGEENK
jgi:ribosomal protein S14